MGALSRRKGAAFERAMVRLFREVFGEENCRRGLQARGGDEVPDVDVPYFWIECKHHKKTNIKAALRQAIEDAPKGRVPIAICKDNRCDPTVTMQLDDFLDFVREWWIHARQ